jgi:hypothetical protein
MSEGKYAQIGHEIGELVDEKNAAYGNSFEKAGDFLRLLYPNGLSPEQYPHALIMVRIFDKQMRLATNKDAFGESPYRDIVGYGILGASIDQREDRRKREKELLPPEILWDTPPVNIVGPHLPVIKT